MIASILLLTCGFAINHFSTYSAALREHFRDDPVFVPEERVGFTHNVADGESLLNSINHVYFSRSGDVSNEKQ